MLEEAHICSVGGGCYRNGKVVHIGDDKAPGDTLVESRDVCDEKERRDGRALGHTHRDWGKRSWGALKDEAASAVSQERASPCYKVRANILRAEQGEEGGGVNVIETTFNIQEERRHFVPKTEVQLNMLL